MSEHDKRAYWCAFNLAFFAYLRIGELISDGVYPALCVGDMKMSYCTLSILLKRSKTDQRGKGQIIQLHKTGRSVCPVTAFQKYHCSLCTNGLDSADQPLFRHLDGSSITQPSFRKVLRTCIIGVPNHSQYSSHSFRIGAATTAARHGETADNIKRSGRWKSGVYNGYIRTKTTGLRLK